MFKINHCRLVIVIHYMNGVEKMLETPKPFRMLSGIVRL